MAPPSAAQICGLLLLLTLVLAPGLSKPASATPPDTHRPKPTPAALGSSLGPTRGYEVADTRDFLAGADADLALYVRIMILRAHIDAASRLAITSLEAARNHFDYAKDDYYEPIRHELARRGIRGFAAELEAFEAAIIDNLPPPVLISACRSFDSGVGRALGSISQKLRGSPEFMLESIALMLQVASDRYRDAFVNFRIENVDAYSDSFVIVKRAKELFRSAERRLRAADEPIFLEIERVFMEFTEAWPSFAPPARAEFSVSTVQGLSATFEIWVRRHLAKQRAGASAAGTQP